MRYLLRSVSVRFTHWLKEKLRKGRGREGKGEGEGEAGKGESFIRVSYGFGEVALEA